MVGFWKNDAFNLPYSMHLKSRVYYCIADLCGAFVVFSAFCFKEA